jgi:hypothetical protein
MDTNEVSKERGKKRTSEPQKKKSLHAPKIAFFWSAAGFKKKLKEKEKRRRMKLRKHEKQEIKEEPKISAPFKCISSQQF